MLLISRYVLDIQPYNLEDKAVTWENCTLRIWLNNDFYNTAFSSSEQDKIEPVIISNPDSCYGAEGGNDTKDKIFCLSVDEISKYYTYSSVYGDAYGYCQILMTEITPSFFQKNRYYSITINQQLYDEYFLSEGYDSTCVGMVTGDWWLRSPGINNRDACMVSYSGRAGWNCGYIVNYKHAGVRPAMWIDISDGGINEAKDEIVTEIAKPIVTDETTERAETTESPKATGDNNTVKINAVYSDEEYDVYIPAGYELTNDKSESGVFLQFKNDDGDFFWVYGEMPASGYYTLHPEEAGDNQFPDGFIFDYEVYVKDGAPNGEDLLWGYCYDPDNKYGYKELYYLFFKYDDNLGTCDYIVIEMTPNTVDQIKKENAGNFFKGF